MLAAEKQQILFELDEGQKALALALDGVDEAEAKWKATPREWSILECVEHLVLSEEFLLSRLEAARPASGVVANRAREAVILSRGLDRSASVESPEAGRPRGRFSNLQEAIAKFAEVRKRTVSWVNGMEGDDLRLLVTDHPLIPGPVNCHEMLLIISVHPRRHSEQIQSIRSLFAQLIRRQSLGRR